MIKEIPTTQDFNETAEQLLMSAYNNVYSLVVDYFEWEEDFDPTAYWQAEWYTLTAAYALAQQATEFFIKARICAISPYLLISNAHLPKASDKKDISFSEFRTIDAQYLIKMHDTVFNERLDDRFKQKYDTMRKIRNKVIHTVDKSLPVEYSDLIETILYIHKIFGTGVNWLNCQFLEIEISKDGIVDYNKQEHESQERLAIYSELSVLDRILSPSKLKEYFDYNKNDSSVDCPSCVEVIAFSKFQDYEWNNQKYKPFKPISNSENYCIICLYQGSIISSTCSEDGCDGTLIDKASQVCLECGVKN